MPGDFIAGMLLGCFIAFSGSFVNHLLAKDRDMRREFNEAAIGFRKIFEGLLATIYQNPNLTSTQIANDILAKSYRDQRISMGTLCRQMWFFRRRAFSKVWQEYENPENCGNEPFLSYQGIPFEPGKAYDREYILNAIKHLISFANK